ncbi:MAG: hypothetical protein KME54_18765 [Tolypothrix brevis GSE-NOS-MK-07-07A]|nr:hypothetical protein [Tolypothrix brevis GSE-NOS-MK-07-07A]
MCCWFEVMYVGSALGVRFDSSVDQKILVKTFRRNVSTIVGKDVPAERLYNRW